ncbi:MAG: ankyrin repeat domain-containing protein [Alphaproteobacteria bacterium]
MADRITQDEFFDAIARGDLEMVKTQLPGSANWGMEVSAGMKLMGGGLRMPLHQAALFGQVEVARLLVEAGAKLNLKDKSLNTPLQQAAECRKTDFALFMIESGADVDATSSVGDTALMMAASTGNYKLAEALIAAGANINARAESGYSALHCAAGGNDRKMMGLLIRHGIDTTIRNDAGEVAGQGDANLTAFIAGAAERRAEEQAFIQNQIDMVRRGSDTPVAVRKPINFRKAAP